MVVVLLDEYWVAGKLIDFTTEVKTESTRIDKIKLRFETAFLASLSQQYFFLVIHYIIYISNTPLPSHSFHQVFKLAIEEDQLSKLSWSISRLVWTMSEPH